MKYKHKMSSSSSKERSYTPPPPPITLALATIYMHEWKLVNINLIYFNLQFCQTAYTATAYVNRIISVPPIKSTVSCPNALKEKGYRNKIVNPDTLLKIIPFQKRQRWTEVANDITYNTWR